MDEQSTAQYILKDSLCAGGRDELTLTQHLYDEDDQRPEGLTKTR